MVLPPRLGNWGFELLRLTRYPRPLRTIVNRMPTSLSIRVDGEPEIHRLCHFSGDISLGRDVRIGPRSHLDGTIDVGRGTNLVRADEVIGDVTFGNYCAIARDVTIQQTNHETQKPATQMRFYRRVLDSTLDHVSSGPITIGSDVWVGTGAKLLSGIEVGHGAIVGAGSVVTNDVPPYAIHGGVPAEHLKWRFPEHIREQLLDIAWWEWSEETMRQNQRFFDTALTDVDDIEAELLE